MSQTPFISWLGHGAVDLAPPGVFTGAKANMFAFGADAGALQALADKLLNPAGSGVVRYLAPLPMAMASFMDIARCSSGTEVVGWLPGRECALWVPLLETWPGDPLRDRLVMWSPYIFIDYCIGLVVGRETWGWPKAMAEIAMPGDDPSASAFDCRTTYFPTLSSATRGVTGSLLRIQQSGAAAPDPIWRTGLEALEGIAGRLLGGLARELVDKLRLRPQFPSVALKQFRQAGAAELACYRAICDSPIEVTAFRGGAPMTGAYSLEVTTCESHPIVADFLGRSPDPGATSLPVVFAAQLDMDFQALSGADIVVG